MKKYLAIFLIFIITAPISALSLETNYKQEINYDKTSVLLNDFTHTVFAEECTATWCPNCPYAAEALYNIYQSGDYPFYYVSLINDMNPNAKERLSDFTWGIYRGYAFPTVYFDGGIINMVGRINSANSVGDTEAEYREIIEESGTRLVTTQIDLEKNVLWEDNAKIMVNVDVTNTGNKIFFGKLRSYIAEIESRWNDQDGNPYHFGFLDFAIDKIILLLPGKTLSISESWDGKQDHNGITFEDITKDNLIIISTISHWIPKYQTGYETDTFTQKYLAFTVNQCSAAIPE